MSVIAKILDVRDDEGSQCYLTRITLEDYVNGLPTTYQDYDVQREIVSNVYLDHLVETILGKRHIPSIVLVVEDGDLALKHDSLEINSFKILDGLQRTYRLQAIRETIRYCIDKLEDQVNYLELNKFKFSRQFSADMRELNSNTKVLRSVLQGYKELGETGLVDTFRQNIQWFEVWTGLSPEEEVQKMLMLNAGHKPVKTRHQLELLFLNLLPFIRTDEACDFKLVREKEVSSTQFSKNRMVGSFHFAHIITSLLSFYNAKPVTPSASLIQNIQATDSSLEEYGDLTSPEFLKDFVTFLVMLDQLLAQQYNQIGVTWMGREVTLAGLFGALGQIAEITGDNRQAVMLRIIDNLRANPEVLNLEQYENVRNNLNLSKVNIGNANRSAVFTAVKSLFGNAPPTRIDWSEHFGLEEK